MDQLLDEFVTELKPLVLTCDCKKDDNIVRDYVLHIT